MAQMTERKRKQGNFLRGQARDLQYAIAALFPKSCKEAAQRLLKAVQAAQQRS